MFSSSLRRESSRPRTATVLVLGALLGLGCAGEAPPAASAPAAVQAPRRPRVLDIRALLERSSEEGGSESTSENKAARRRLDGLLALTRPPEGPPRERTRLASALKGAEGPEQNRQARRSVAAAYQRMGDSRRAQQIWRNLVCPERYRDPFERDDAKAAALAQDHDPELWRQWYRGNPEAAEPDRLLVDGRRKNGGRPPTGRSDAAPIDTTDEQRYLPIFGALCRQPESAKAGSAEARLSAETWLAMGTDYALGGHPEAGPYRLHRALEALQHAEAWSRDGRNQNLLVATLLWLADVHLRAQHFREAAESARAGLSEADRLSSAAVRAVFERRASVLFAMAITSPQFNDPVTPGSFVRRRRWPKASECDEAAVAMSVGILRVQNPAIVPQDRNWTPSVFLAVLDQYERHYQAANHIALDEVFLRRFPAHSLAPRVQLQQGQFWFQRAQLAPRTSPLQRGYRDKAEATLADIDKRYGPGSAWAGAHRTAPEVLSAASEVRRRARESLTRVRAPRPRR